MKVLLFCPTYRLEPETLDSIMRLDPAGHELDILFTRHNAHKHGSFNILANYQHGWNVALANGYDAMMTVESDMVIPADALRRLVAVEGADIVTGLYVHRHFIDPKHPFWSPQYWDEETTEPTTWLNWLPGEGAKAWGNIIRISGGGFGCALIYRRVLEAITPRLTIFAKRLVTDCDTPFYADVLRQGFVAKCDMALICGHKRPDGFVMYPDPHEQMREFASPILVSPYNLEVLTNGTTHT